MFSLEANYIREQYNIIKTLKRELLSKEKEIEYLGKSVSHAMEKEEEKEPVSSFISEAESQCLLYASGPVKHLLDTGNDISAGTKHRSVFLTLVCINAHNLTTIINDLAPVKALELIDEYYKIIINSLSQFDGLLDKILTGTSIGYFGFNKENEFISDKQAAVNAVYFALDCNKNIESFNVMLNEAGLPLLSIGISVHSGQVLCGSVGNDIQKYFLLAGTEFLLTTKLEGLNKMFNTDIIISSDTYELIKEKIEVNPLKKITIKEFDKEIMLYSLVDLKEEEEVPGIPVDEVIEEDSLEAIDKEEEIDDLSYNKDVDSSSLNEEDLISEPDEKLLAEFENELEDDTNIDHSDKDFSSDDDEILARSDLLDDKDLSDDVLSDDELASLELDDIDNLDDKK